MSEFVAPILQWLNTNPEYSGLATFVISAAESVAIIGTIVPGSITMTAIGALAGAGIIPLWPTLFWAIMGAILGDGISYWIGHYFKDRLPTVWPFKNYPGFLESGERFVSKYGYMSVFIGRFVGPVRALVPVVAGMLGMPSWKFFLANVTSAIGWAPAYMLPGILMGAASTELPPDIAIHVVLVFLLIGLFVLLCLWFLYKILQWIYYHSTNAQMRIWNWLTRNKYLSHVTNIFKHHDEVKTRTQVSLGFYFLDAIVLFLILVFFVKVSGAANMVVNDAVFHLFRGIRNPTLDAIMLNFTILGQKEVLFTTLIVASIFLFFTKRKRAAYHLVALGVLAGGAVFVLKHLIHSIRPWGILNSPESFSMPSGHATLSATVFFGLAYFLTRNAGSGRRWFFFSLATILSFAVAISRLYLGAHWFTDILAGWLLSAAILMVVIISFQRRKSAAIKVIPLCLVILSSYLIFFGVYYYLKFEKMLTDYAQIDYAVNSIDANKWWQTDGDLPAYHVSLFGFPSEQINVQWVGDLDKIKQTLITQGWSVPPERDFASVLHRVADIQSSEYLSLISPQYLDKNPELTMIRRVNNTKNLIVIRLWNSNRFNPDNNTPLWVGVVGMVPRSYSWLVQSHPGTIKIDSKFVFPSQAVIANWQWKMLELHFSKTNQRVLLIREK